MQHQKRLLLCLAPLALTLLGCPGDLESPGRFDSELGDCPDIEKDIIPKDCALANCHKPPNLMNKLDLTQPDLLSTLSGKPAVGGPGLLIDPAHPAESVLYTKITMNPPFGARMPFTKAALDDGTEACFLSWIQDGVKGTTP